MRQVKIETISWTGQSLERVEDAALLTGRGRFIDDLGVYAVRYVGLTILVALFVAMRRRIHAMAPTKKGKPAAA